MEVKIIVQEEVIVRGTFVSYVLYYEATNNGVAEQPMAYDASFIAAFKAKLTQPSASGESYSLVLVSLTHTVSKKSAFSFFMSSVIVDSRREEVAKALATAMNSVSGRPVYLCHYFI